MNSWLDVLISVGNFVRPAAVGMVLLGTWLATGRAKLDPAARRKTMVAVAVPLLVWLAVAQWLAASGAYAPWPGRGSPLLPLAVALPLGIGLLFLTRSRRIGRLLDSIPTGWLVGLQAYRVFGGVFLIQWARGLAPGVFAIPAGIGDILVGVVAVLLARHWISRQPGKLGPLYAWNALGITDLVLALTLGILSSPGPMQILAVDHPNRLAYPLVLIPTFAVPLSLLLHGLSLRQLGRRRRTATLPGSLEVA